MAQQSSLQQTKTKFPPIETSNKLFLNTSLKRIRRNREVDTYRSVEQKSHSPALKQEKVISHFLIKYLERKEHFEEREDKHSSKTIIGEQKKQQRGICSSFRRALLKRRHSPKKPLQTRFLIANYDSIAFV